MFANPAENLKFLNLTDGMKVADLGAGSGAYTLVLARMMPSVKVYAIEVQKDLLTRLQNDAKSDHLTNVEVVWANIEKIGGTKLADRSVDAVILSNVFFQVEDRVGCAKETKRILKPGGEVLFVDWTDSFGGMGSSKDTVITKADALAIFQAEGLAFERDIDVGSHHYGIIMKRTI